MITVFIAMKQEAAPLIERLSLKHTPSPIVETYENERIRLIITGLGKINAASAAGFCLGRYGTDTHYINYGTAAGEPALIGKAFFAAQITDDGSDREYFPDIADHSFPHVSLHTVDRPVNPSDIQTDMLQCGFKSIYDNPTDNQSPESTANTGIPDNGISAAPCIYDMEAAGLFCALKNAVTPDRITIIKTVTDSGKPDFSKTKQILESSADAVCTYIKNLCRQQETAKVHDEDFADKLCKVFKCSDTMSNQLKQYVRYMEVSGNHDTLIKRLDELTQKGLLPAPDRRHGKQALAIFMNNPVR